MHRSPHESGNVNIDANQITSQISPYESGNVNIYANQITSQISSTVTEVFSEKDTSLLGKREFLTMQLDVSFFHVKVM